MSLQKAFRQVLSTNGNTFTSSNETTGESLPTQLFESFIPGYGPIHKFILFTFGLDITHIVTFLGAVWAICKLGSYVYKTFSSLISENYMSSVTVNNHDDIFNHMIKWLSAQPNLQHTRSLNAETESRSAWELMDEDDIQSLAMQQESQSDDGFDYLQILNFSNQEAKAPPRYSPAHGTHQFWHHGHYFKLQRSQNTVFDGSSGSATFAERENITLSCFGRSTQPIKNLLQDAKDFYLLDHHVKTIIRRPAIKDIRRWGNRSSWTVVAHRPCRPMDTVVLDKKRKMEVLADINEYLHPATPRWYASRGIPYRRGYLFYGPPGTGKTSLSFALAGVFGLDIYVVSLLEPTLTEEDLGQLFNTLPRRCVVLLEDIDTAGLTRSEPSETTSHSASTKESSDATGMKDLAKAIRKAQVDSSDKKETGISLSGLLNVIDGVASHEGRVLVMTTNHPENLDDALIRPGRIDLQVAFSNATQSQIKELFERMYIEDAPRLRPGLQIEPKRTPSDDVDAKKTSILTPPATPTESKERATIDAVDTVIKADFGFPERSLEDCATEFASKIPDGMFSPAEVQGYLLKRKKNPQKACSEVERWVEGMMSGRDKKTKVLDVQ